jgi:hypothetical protein
MTVREPSAVVLRAHRTDLAQPPSSVLEVVTLPPSSPPTASPRRPSGGQDTSEMGAASYQVS